MNVVRISRDRSEPNPGTCRRPEQQKDTAASRNQTRADHDKSDIKATIAQSPVFSRVILLAVWAAHAALSQRSELLESTELLLQCRCGHVDHGSPATRRDLAVSCEPGFMQRDGRASNCSEQKRLE